jgi:succinoglycan biosynthesis protein ExoA
MDVDVVIPAFNEERHIDACLRHVVAQEYAAGRMRIWVVDAGSTDGTAAAVRDWAARDARIALVDGGGRLNAAEALNAGIALGSAEVVARVDAHSELAPDYLAAAVRLLGSLPSDVACVGGQPEQVGETRFGRAVAIARRSRFGVGGSVYADRRERAFVDTVQAGVYRRPALEAVGGFATTMLVGEDEELNWRLRRAGYRLLLDSCVRFRYATRPSWPALFRQHRNYGRSRVRVVAAHPAYLRPRHALPAAFVAGLGTLAGLAGARPATRPLLAGALAAYGAAALGAAASASRREEPGLAPAVAACFAAMHLGYGVGTLEGIAELAGRRLGIAEPPSAVRRR